MQNPEAIFEQLDSLFDESDEAYEIYAKAKIAHAQVRAEKYEQVENEAGEVIYIPLEHLMDELTEQEVQSGRFVSKLGGRTSKEERAAELESYMRKNVPAYNDYDNRLQRQVITEAMGNATALVAEKNYARSHTKIMALRSELDFLTQHTRVEAAKLEVERDEVFSEGRQAIEKEHRQNVLDLEHERKARSEQETECVRIQKDTAEIEYKVAELNQNHEVDVVRAAAAEELATYKKAVEPLLRFAESFKELQKEG